MAAQGAQAVLKHGLQSAPAAARLPAKPQLAADMLPLPSCLQVKSLNGQRIMNLKDLVRLVDSCSDKYLHLDLEHNQWVARMARLDEW